MFERISWLLLALGHLPPFMALFKPSLISKLYSVPLNDPSFALLHHRAALFGVVFISCIWAAFDPEVRKLAFVVTGLSMISFLAIYFSYGQPQSIRTIAIVDGAALPMLVYVGWKVFKA